MKVNPDQINQLYAFTRKHFVEHYDVQTELVDHLANGIEAQWRENSNIPFETALNQEFKKFGVFGFMDTIDMKKKAMSRKYQRLFWNLFKQWFHWPQLGLTLGLILALNTTLGWIGNANMLRNTMIFLSIGLMTLLLVRFYRLKQRHPLGQKKYLLEEMIFRAGNMVTFFNLKLQVGMSLMHTSDAFVMNSYLILTFSCLFVLGLLAAYVVFWKLPANAPRILEEAYPESSIILDGH